MPEDDLAGQIRTRLAGLAAAGVEWLPRAPAPPARVLVPIDGGRVVVADAASPDGRRRELALLAERVCTCDRCPELVATRTQTVFGIGPVGADICFIGEAPGFDEDRAGEPFVGPAGQMLNRIIAACELRREDIYLCNILRCRPPGNRQPKPEEAANCREYLDRTLELVRPNVICCWGGTAAQNLLGSTIGITQLRGKWYEYRDIPVLCTFHPAALLEGRSPEKKKYVWEDMKMLLTKLGRPLPGAKKG